VSNGWMDQDAIWYVSRPWPRWHCFRWGPSFPPKRGTAPICGPCLLWPNSWMGQDATWYGGTPRPRPHWGPSSRTERVTAPPLFGPCLLWPNCRPS